MGDESKYTLIASFILIIITVNQQGECYSHKMDKKQNQLTSYAISSIMNQIATSGVHSRAFTIYTVKNDNCFDCFADLMTKIMQKLNIAVNVIVENKSKNMKVLSGINIVLLNDCHNQTISKFSLKPTYKKSFVLSYNGYASQIAANSTIVNVNVEKYENTLLYHSKDMQSLFLFTNVLFEEEKCRATFRRINAFNTSRLAWESNEFYQTFGRVDDKYQNCFLKIHQQNGTFEQPDHKVFNLMIDLFAETYNFVPDYTDNKTNMHDIFISLNIMVMRSNLKSSAIHSYYRSHYISYYSLTFVVTTGAPYTPFEKLILPFDNMTWILCVVCFIIGQLTIFVTLHCNENAKNFIFGKKVTNPSLTMAQIFFGVGLVRIPGRNFARYLFMMFTLFCLVMRTAYQGKMFNFLHNNLKKATAKTTDEMFSWKIPILLPDTLRAGNELPFYHHEASYQVIDSDIFRITLRDQILYENDTFAFGIGRDRLSDTYSNYTNEYREYFRVLDDDYATIPLTFYMKTGSFISELLDSFILKCHEHGLVKFIESKIFSKTLIEHDEKPPQVLDMYKLSAGFIIWLTSVLIACIVFFFEIIFGYCSNAHSDNDDDDDDDYDDRNLINILSNNENSYE